MAAADNDHDSVPIHFEEFDNALADDHFENGRQ